MNECRNCEYKNTPNESRFCLMCGHEVKQFDKTEKYRYVIETISSPHSVLDKYSKIKIEDDCITIEYSQAFSFNFRFFTLSARKFDITYTITLGTSGNCTLYIKGNKDNIKYFIDSI